MPHFGEGKKKVCVIEVYKITMVIYKVNVKLGFTRSSHIRIKGHSVFLTEVIFYVKRRSA